MLPSRVPNGEQRKDVSDRVLDVFVLKRAIAPNAGSGVARNSFRIEECKAVGFLNVDLTGGNASHRKRGFNRRLPKIR